MFKPLYVQKFLIILRHFLQFCVMMQSQHQQNFHFLSFRFLFKVAPRKIKISLNHNSKIAEFVFIIFMGKLGHIPSIKIKFIERNKFKRSIKITTYRECLKIAIFLASFLAFFILFLLSITWPKQ